MTIYKNPYVSRECYFIKTGKASSCKNGASKSSGYIVEFTQGKWEVRKGSFYDSSLKEMPIVVKNRTSIETVIKKAILNEVLNLIKSEE